MVDDVAVLQPMIRQAVHIDHVGAVAAAGEADIGLARFARAVDHAADHRNGHRRCDVGKAPFQQLDGLDHLELLPRDRKSTRLNSSHSCASRMPSSACKKKNTQTKYK